MKQNIIRAVSIVAIVFGVGVIADAARPVSPKNDGNVILPYLELSKDTKNLPMPAVEGVSQTKRQEEIIGM